MPSSRTSMMALMVLGSVCSQLLIGSTSMMISSTAPMMSRLPIKERKAEGEVMPQGFPEVAGRMFVVQMDYSLCRRFCCVCYYGLCQFLS